MKTITFAFAAGLLSMASTAFASSISNPPNMDTTTGGPIISVININFLGVCSDCSGTATGTLTLFGSYVFGTTLTAANIFSFQYNGTNLVPAFTLTNNFVIFGGSIPSGLTSSPLSLDFLGRTAGNVSWELFTSSAGFWDLCSNTCGDFGQTNAWSNPANTPEPASWELFAVAMLAAAIGRPMVRFARR